MLSRAEAEAKFESLFNGDLRFIGRDEPNTNTTCWCLWAEVVHCTDVVEAWVCGIVESDGQVHDLSFYSSRDELLKFKDIVDSYAPVALEEFDF